MSQQCFCAAFPELVLIGRNHLWVICLLCQVVFTGFLPRAWCTILANESLSTNNPGEQDVVLVLKELKVCRGDRQGNVEENGPGNTVRELVGETAALFPQRAFLSMYFQSNTFLPPTSSPAQLNLKGNRGFGPQGASLPLGLPRAHIHLNPNLPGSGVHAERTTGFVICGRGGQGPAARVTSHSDIYNILTCQT